jgi:hypothetical protein
VTTIWYATREDVASALDYKETARNWGQVDRALDASSLTIEGDGMTARRFYPELDTRTFDWPVFDRRISVDYRRLWLDANELISVTSITVDGVALTSDDYHLRRADERDEPPYEYVDIARSVGSPAIPERAVSIVGTYGYNADTTPAGALGEALDTTETAVDVTNSAAVGVGSLLVVESERMLVTGKSMLDTGQNTGGALTSSAADTTVPVTTGSAYAVGEVILIDAERMRIVDVAGNNLIVKRSWDGSVLAAHSVGADIYAPRTLTVERGGLGTTAATHADATAVRVQVYPGPVRSLAIAEAITQLQQEMAGYGRVIGVGEGAIEASGKGLRDLRNQVRQRYARMDVGFA